MIVNRMVYVKGFPFILLVTLLFTQFPINAQDIATDNWREHLPYNRGVSLAATENGVYCATMHSMFFYNKRDFSVSTMSKNNGLSDVGFSKLAYHKPSGTLIIAYNNANIDLIQNGKISNLSDIKRQNIPINKVINNITLKDNEAWLSCGFGIVIINIEKQEFKETYLIGENGAYTNVYDIDFFDDTVYAATDAGILRAAMDDYLLDYSFWKRWEELPYPEERYNTLAFFNGMPFVNLKVGNNSDDTLFHRENGVWKHFTEYGYEVIHQLEVFDNRLVVSKMDNVVVLDSDMKVYRHIYDYTAGFESVVDVVPAQSVVDSEGFLWIADNRNGLAFIYDQWAYKLITPNGPETTLGFHMACANDQLWVATGAYSSTWSMTFNIQGAYHFDGFTWKAVNLRNEPALDTIYDMVCVTIDPSDASKVYLGTWDKGLVYLKDGKLAKVFDQTNSSLGVLENNALGIYKVAVGGLAFDQQGNLWVTNGGVTRSLSVMKPDGKWRSFDISSPDMKMTDRVSGKVVIDRIGQKWVLLGRGYGIQVFNDNNTIDNPNDDKTTNISGAMGRGNLPSTVVFDIATDLDGRIWIGSDKGIAVIYAPENVFTGYNYDAQQILVNQDGYDQYLLENESVTAIAVDGGNRKWIGTEKSGVFLLSPDGTREIRRFTENNSPLLSNGIRSIAINHNNGEVFFATDKGIISYRSDATGASPVHTEVKVFPNPVAPEYSGVISITGLVRDADVKITNTAGEVVFSARANGGMAVWNGKDLSGRKVATGVYLVFSSDQTGLETAVSKILFIR